MYVGIYPDFTSLNRHDAFIVRAQDFLSRSVRNSQSVHHPERYMGRDALISLAINLLGLVCIPLEIYAHG